MKNCLDCGQAVQDTESYCPRCGSSSLVVDKSTRQSKPFQTNSGARQVASSPGGAHSNTLTQKPAQLNSAPQRPRVGQSTDSKPKPEGQKTGTHQRPSGVQKPSIEQRPNIPQRPSTGSRVIQGDVQSEVRRNVVSPDDKSIKPQNQQKKVAEHIADSEAEVSDNGKKRKQEKLPKNKASNTKQKLNRLTCAILGFIVGLGVGIISTILLISNSF